MRHRPHVSWLIAVGSVGIVVGAAGSAYLDARYWSGPEWLIVALLGALASLMSRSKLAVIIILFAGLSLGVWRGSQLLVGLEGLRSLQGSSTVVVGRVLEDPTLSKTGDVQMKLGDITVDGHPLDGVLWASVSAVPDVKRSDYVSVSGDVSEGFGNIPTAIFRGQLLSIERQDYIDVGRDARDSFAGGIRSAISEPEASLASGFLVGQKTELPEKLSNDMKLLGLTHIVVASGYNLSILIRFTRRWLAKISRFTALAAGGALVYGFVHVTGFSPSMARASLVTGLSLVSWYYGRKVHPVILLAFAAGLTVMIDPSYSWGDLGWLLSFTSFVGVMILSPLLNRYFWGEKDPGPISQVVIETMSAQVLTLPITLYVFGQYSPLSLLANVLILPLISVTMLLSFIAGFAGLVASSYAAIVGAPAQIVLMYMTAVVDYLAALPSAENEIKFGLSWLVVGYILIFWLVLFLRRRSNYEFREYNIIE